MKKQFEIYMTVEAPEYQKKTIEKQIEFAINSHTDITVQTIEASRL